MAFVVQVSEDRRMTFAAGAERIDLPTLEEDMIASLSIDYGDYRREIRRLRQDHPLFQPGVDISFSDLENLTAEALMLLTTLQEIDPVGCLCVAGELDPVLRCGDDGSASFVLAMGMALLEVLEDPIHTQARLRNIFEVTFDGTERMTRRERFDLLREIYPDVAEHCDPDHLCGSPAAYRVSSLYGFRLLELALYFKQEGKRIARCDYCWGYFIPKTRAATRYCDRIFDGQSCKRRGANQQRREEKDAALTKCDQLRDRMVARMLRYEDAAPEEREGLIPFSSRSGRPERAYGRGEYEGTSILTRSRTIPG